ncbi:MAG: family 16 glycosylhydrolase [Candidatus Neomarinimicrobiota bacterium]
MINKKYFIFVFLTTCYAGQVTFIVNMSEETIVAGDGDYPAVYLSGANINGPSGLEMNDNGDGIWQITINLQPGDYTYKFRNGYYDYWDSPGWESDNSLIDGGCAHGTYFDRLVSVQNNDLVEGPFCFGNCDEICFDESSIEYELVWSDEFDGNGAIDTLKWHHQTQLPNGNSWYNGEIQHYTDREQNSYVSDGTMKIVALRETYTDQGHTKDFTSARLNSKFAFTNGKVEVRARLPEGVGTWPAIWMLGQNISEPGAYWETQGYGTTGWPFCGEIDIMEHWGGNQNYIQSAIHTPSSYGGTINHGGQYVANSTNDFNIYTLEWTEEKMVFSVNDNPHYTYNPAIKNSDTWPFEDPQYLILNIAIEQSISQNFTAASMEIDYVKIYEAVTLLNYKNLNPRRFQLFQNYPNPFNPSTTLKYILSDDDLVRITIYDMLGNEVKNLIDTKQSSGFKSIQWNATNNRGQLVSAGVYLYSIEVGEYRNTKKMILLK